MAFEKLQAATKAVDASEAVLLTQDRIGANRRALWAAALNVMEVKKAQEGRKLFIGSDSFALSGIMKLLEDMHGSDGTGEIHMEGAEPKPSTVNAVAALNAVEEALKTGDVEKAA